MNSPDPLVIKIRDTDVQLRQLRDVDVGPLHALTVADATHLTAFGDYEDIVNASPEQLATELASGPDEHWRLGVWWRDTLIGRVDLVPAAPKNYTLGYWLGSDYCGRGFATRSCQALMDHAQSTLEIEAFWAGVKHANVKSAAVLYRLGFEPVEDLPTHLRFRRTVGLAR